MGMGVCRIGVLEPGYWSVDLLKWKYVLMGMGV